MRSGDAIFPIFQTDGAMYRRTASGRLQSYGVSLPMYRVMAALWQRDGQCLGDLSEMTSVEISTLSRLVHSMPRKGNVSRQRPDFDGRAAQSLSRSL
jgi:DNA-binding MarR family transcriptional regulator